MTEEQEVKVKEAVKKVIETTKTMPDGTVKYKCRYCGKWITKEENLDLESGDYCRHLREEGMDDQFLADYRKERTVAQPPEGWVKIAAVHRACDKAGIPISALVRAFGGDRGLGEPLREEFRFVYSGRARWVNPWCMTPEGLAFLKGISRNGGEGKAAKTEKEPAGAKTRKSVKPESTEEALLNA